MQRKLSQREIKRQYNQLLSDVKNKEFYTEINLKNRVNCYTCAGCDHVTKTKDIDAGVISFMFSCESCGCMAQSSFFKDIRPEQKPTFEWYRPSLKKVLKMRKKSNFLDHILKGGLDFRKIETNV